MSENKNLTAIANAVVMLNAILIDELDKRGAISKANYAQLLFDVATAAEQKSPEHLQGQFRLDLFLMRRVAENLSAEKPSWKPVVIEGGKLDDQE